MEFLSKHQQVFYGRRQAYSKIYLESHRHPAPSIIKAILVERNREGEITFRNHCHSDKDHDRGIHRGRDTDRQSRTENRETSPQQCGSLTFDRGAPTVCGGRTFTGRNWSSPITSCLIQKLSRNASGNSIKMRNHNIFRTKKGRKKSDTWDYASSSQSWHQKARKMGELGHIKWEGPCKRDGKTSWRPGGGVCKPSFLQRTWPQYTKKLQNPTAKTKRAIESENEQNT